MYEDGKYIYIKYNIFCFLVLTFHSGRNSEKNYNIVSGLKKSAFYSFNLRNRQSDKQHNLWEITRKNFSAFSKRKHGKLQISLYELREDLLKQIYYVRRRSLCCCCFFSSVVSLVFFSCRAFFALSACKFFSCFSFYVFLCYGIKVEKRLFRPILNVYLSALLKYLQDKLCVCLLHHCRKEAKSQGML